MADGYNDISSIRRRKTAVEEADELKTMNLEDEMDNLTSKPVSQQEPSLADIFLHSPNLDDDSPIFDEDDDGNDDFDEIAGEDLFLSKIMAEKEEKERKQEELKKKVEPKPAVREERPKPNLASNPVAENVKPNKVVEKPVEKTPVENVDKSVENSVREVPKDKTNVPKVTAGSQKLEKAKKLRDTKAKTSGNSSKVSSKTNRIKKEERYVGEYSVLRDVPKELITECRRDFPGAKNNTDVLVAWIVAHASIEFVAQVSPYLTESQVALVSAWDASPEVSMQNSIDRIIRMLISMNERLDTNELMSAFLAFDRLGFRKENPPSPNMINFMENGVIEAVVQAEAQVQKMKYQRSKIKDRGKV